MKKRLISLLLTLSMVLSSGLPVLAGEDNDSYHYVYNNSSDDYDNDGIINEDEIEMGTNPYIKDSDFDSLSDSYEIEIGTDPICEDTDGDGASDGLEIEYDTDPLIFNPNFTEIAETQLLSDMFSITVSAKAIVGGESLGSFSLNPVTYNDVPFISKTIPGYIGNACELSFVGDAEKVTLEFTYDITQEMEDDAFEPVIYQFDFVSQDFHEVLDQTSREGVITATVYECGIFIMLNKAEYDPIETYSMFSLARAVPSTNLEDYYEDIYWGRISLVGGAKAFAGYDFSVNNDYDGDGLTNDEEIEIRVNSNGTPEIYMYSNPVYSDSDGDGMEDAEDKYPLIYSYSTNATSAIDNLLNNSLYKASYVYDEVYEEFGERVWTEAFSILGTLEYGTQKEVIKSVWMEYLNNYHDYLLEINTKQEQKIILRESYLSIIDSCTSSINDITSEMSEWGDIAEDALTDYQKKLRATREALKKTRMEISSKLNHAIKCSDWDEWDIYFDDWKKTLNSIDTSQIKIETTGKIRKIASTYNNVTDTVFKAISISATVTSQIDDYKREVDALVAMNANANAYSTCIALFDYIQESDHEDNAIVGAASEIYDELNAESINWGDKAYIALKQIVQAGAEYAIDKLWDMANLTPVGSILKFIMDQLIKGETTKAYKQNHIIANESLVRAAKSVVSGLIKKNSSLYTIPNPDDDNIAYADNIVYVSELLLHLAQLRLNGEIKFTEAREGIDFLCEKLDRIQNYVDYLNLDISDNLIERCYLVTDPNITISITDDIDVNDSDFDFTPAQGDYKIYFNGEQQYYSVTGSDKYTFHLTPGYTYVVTVVGWYNSSNTGYHYQRQKITVSEDQTYNLAYTFNYYDGTYVEGTVTGDSINSVNGTNISIREGHNNKSGNVSASCVYPNYGNNHYRILLPKGDYTAEVSCKGYDTKYYNFTVTGAQVLQTQNFSLASQLQVTGHVVNDQTGAAIANAKVTLYHDLLSGMDVVFYTDSTGHIAEYASLSTILNKARIEADGYLPKTIDIDYNMTSNRYMLGEIELSPTYTYTVSGKVTDGSNAIKGVQVTLNNADGVAYSPVVTDNNGKYSFNNIAKGIYRLVLTHTDYETAEKNLTVNNSNVTVEDIVMNKKTVTQTYTIKFDANGGSYKDTSTVKSLIKTHDVPLVFNVEQPTRDGYDFLGWAGTKTATSREYMQGGTFQKNVSMYLYAVWKKQDTSATMVYDHGDWIVNPNNPNESIVEHADPIEIDVSSGTTYALVDPVISSYNGNSFKGWQYYKNGGTLFDANGYAYTLLQVGDTIELDPTDGVENYVLAKWQYYIHYNSGSDIVHEQGVNDYVIKAPAVAYNSDQVFKYWKNGNTKYYVGDVIDLTSDLTLTAVWGTEDKVNTLLTVLTDKATYEPGDTVKINITAENSQYFRVDASDNDGFKITDAEGRKKTSGVFVENSSASDADDLKCYDDGETYTVKLYIPDDCENGSYPIDIFASNGTYDERTDGSVGGTETSTVSDPITIHVSDGTEEDTSNYVLMYDLNGGKGTVPETITFAKYEHIVLARQSGFERTGCNFVGWSEDPDCKPDEEDDIYKAGRDYQFSSNKILYAVWDPIEGFGNLSLSLQVERYSKVYKPGETAHISVVPNYSDHFWFDVSMCSGFFVESADGKKVTGATYYEVNSPDYDNSETGYTDNLGIYIPVYIPDNCRNGQYTFTVTAANGRVNDSGSSDKDKIEQSVTIYVSDDNKADAIYLDYTRLTLHEGRRKDLDATIEPIVFQDREVEWESSNTRVATVDEDGYVKAKSEGTAIITATVDDVSATCTVTVVECSYTVRDTDPDYLASEATCKEQATYYYSCECGDTGSKTFKVGGLADHSYSDWNTVVEPSEYTAGLKERTCSGCGDVESEAIPATGHNMHTPDDVWHINETHHWHICTGEKCTDVLDRAEHDYSDDIDTMCNVCGYERIVKCSHKEGTYLSAAWQQINPLDDTYHENIICYDERCEVCFEIVNEEVETDRTIEQHVFDDAGICVGLNKRGGCGYAKSCNHTNTTKKYYNNSEFPKYECINENEHEVTYRYYYECNTCGVKINGDRYFEYEDEEHAFNQDTCVKCGYIRNQQLHLEVYSYSECACIGDYLSIKAAASGGAGGYVYVYYVYHNDIEIYQSLADDTPAYGWTAGEAGEYYFMVTVYDNEGNSVSKASSIITVLGYSSVYGDVNGDDILTETDALYLLRYTLLPERYPLRVDNADYDNNDIIDANDAVYLKNCCEGNVAANYVMSGKVTSDGTAPLKDVVVSIVNTKEPTTQYTPVTTDDDGTYSFNVPNGTYTLTFTKENYKTQTAEVTVLNGANVVETITMLSFVDFTITHTNNGVTTDILAASPIEVYYGTAPMTWTITSPSAWTLTKFGDWFTLDKNSGVAGETTLKISIDTYTTSMNEGTVEFTVDGKKYVVRIYQQSENMVAYGKCGDNLDWVLNKSGTLTISGTGDMWGFQEGYEVNANNGAANNQEWYSYKNDIVKVIIKSGVDSIGQYAFAKHSNLETVEIEDGLKRIDSWAFLRCTKLKNINIPNTVTFLGGKLFSYCALTEIYIPESVTFLGSWTFESDGILKDIYFYGDLPHICSADSFRNAKGITLHYVEGKKRWTESQLTLDSYSFPTETWTPSSNYKYNQIIQKGDFEFLIVDGKANLIWYSGSDAEVSIPATVNSFDVVSIASVAFCKQNSHNNGLSNITSIIVPDNIREIHKTAVDGLSNLENIILPSTLISMGEYAIHNNKSLKSVYFYGDFPVINGRGMIYVVATSPTIYYISGKAGWISPKWTAPDGTVYNIATWIPENAD